MPRHSDENSIVMALEAIEVNPKLSLYAAAKIYKVSYTTLRQRQKGRCPRCEVEPNSRKLTELEEESII